MRPTLLGLLLAALAHSSASADQPKPIAIGAKAPDFRNLPAVLGDRETTISLADIKEDVVVIVFLGNHCPFVTMVEDRLIDLANDYAAKSVKLIGVCVTPLPASADAGYQDYAEQDTFPRIKERVQQKGYNFLYARDDSQAIGRGFGPKVTPHAYVLDKNRVVRYSGAIDDNIQNEHEVKKTYLRDAIDAVLAGRDLAVTQTEAIGCPINYLDTP
ncbi:MAG: thioredoxin family protein [Isosphaeraceae bacterium]|jgi:thiol-disulfide isomerase/thioredoxin|nr:MAG: thioredoxin family protein [Isosphaeraceae bacterium]